MGKNPAFQFYPGDWIKDPELRSCSLAARGAWIDILILMSQCKPMGTLATDGVPWSDERIARALGGACDQSVTDAILELKKNGVLKQNKKGFYFSKRMCEIKCDRDKWKKRQRKHRVNRGKASLKCRAPVTPVSRPSSSSSSSSNIKEEIHTVHFEEFWVAYDKKTGRKDCEAWYKKNATDSIHKQIMESIEKWRASGNWDDKQYQFKPLNFLRKEYWREDPPVRNKTNTDGTDPVFRDKFLKGEV